MKGEFRELARAVQCRARRRAPALRGCAVGAWFLAGIFAACERPPAGPPAEITAVYRPAVPDGPEDSAWQTAPAFPATLILQDMVEPRLLEKSTPEVRVQAIADGKRIAFRLEWADETRDDLPGVGRFSDGCAVQLPARFERDVPAPQMGEPGRPVEITYWRAAWQAALDGREDSIKALYPGAAVDHYPFQAPSLKPGSDAQREMELRYALARALGNPMAGPRQRAVEDLVAEGPGTLRRSSQQFSTGRGVRTATGWAAVLSRPLPAWLKPGGRAQVAFAVWQGSHEETGGRKMRSVWFPLHLQGGPQAPEKRGGNP